MVVCFNNNNNNNPGNKDREMNEQWTPVVCERGHESLTAELLWSGSSQRHLPLCLSLSCSNAAVFVSVVSQACHQSYSLLMCVCVCVCTGGHYIILFESVSFQSVIPTGECFSFIMQCRWFNRMPFISYHFPFSSVFSCRATLIVLMCIMTCKCV